MIILQVHNKYLEKGGEDVVVEQEKKLLEHNGHKVYQWIKDNKGIQSWPLVRKWEVAIFSVWSPRSYFEAKKLLKKLKPNVVHVHNTVPQITPSVYYACNKLGIPVVQTLHNYRILAPCGTLNRIGKVCELCIKKKFPYPSIFFRCYRNNFFQSTLTSLNKLFSHIIGSYSKQVSGYVALTEFAKSKFSQSGLNSKKIRVKPNFSSTSSNRGKHQGNYALYVGRLSREKGIMTMLDAWEKIGEKLPLKIVGTGPLMDMVREKKSSHLIVLGWKEKKDVQLLMEEASILIFPSEWYEGFPMVLVEALRAGLPVIASDIGGQNEIIRSGVTGFKFRVGDADDLAEKVLEFIKLGKGDSGIYEQTYHQGRSSYTEEQNYFLMIEFYRDVLQEAGKKKAPSK